MVVVVTLTINNLARESISSLSCSNFVSTTLFLSLFSREFSKNLAP